MVEVRDIVRPRRFLQVFGRMSFLDALLFWSVFSSSMILMLWIVTTSSTDQLRNAIRERAAEITRSSAKLFHHSHDLPATLGALQVVQDEHIDVLQIGLLEWDGTNTRVLSSTSLRVGLVDFGGFKDFGAEVGDPVLIAPRKLSTASEIKKGLIASSESSSTIFSSWKMLENGSLRMFLVRGYPEFIFQRIDQLDNGATHIAVVAFDTERFEPEFLEIDRSSGQVIALGLVLCVLLSLLVRRRSLQREIAIEENLQLLSTLRQRDAILATVAEGADSMIAEGDIQKPLGQMMKELSVVLSVERCYVSIAQQSTGTSQLMSSLFLAGSESPVTNPLTLKELEDAELFEIQELLDSGNSLNKRVADLHPRQREPFYKRGLNAVTLLPVRLNGQLAGLLVFERTEGTHPLRTHVLDTLRLVADFIESAFERQENEKRLVYASKMQALGRVAGGVAHEFNNLLHIIAGNLRRIVKESKTSPASSEKVDIQLASNILEATQRGAQIVDQLLSTTRQSRPVLVQTNLNEMVDKTLMLARSVLNKEVQLKHTYEEELPVVQADEGRIQQVLLNLILNAGDSMESNQGGVIEIKTGIREDSDRSDGDAYVVCSVLDQGSGLSTDVQEHLFEPFFTTKEPGKGTGLGLATCRGILEQHGGFIEARNRYQGGACFSFYLPVESQVSMAADMSSADLGRSVAMSPSGRVKIGVVDDESLCREVVADNLEEKGFEVDSFSSGEELMEVLKTNPGTYDCIVTDWSMPGLSEANLIEEIRKIAPEVMLIVTSGFALNADELDTVDAILQKPFSPDKLFYMIRSLQQ